MPLYDELSEEEQLTLNDTLTRLNSIYGAGTVLAVWTVRVASEEGRTYLNHALRCATNMADDEAFKRIYSK